MLKWRIRRPEAVEDEGPRSGNSVNQNNRYMGEAQSYNLGEDGEQLFKDIVSLSSEEKELEDVFVDTSIEGYRNENKKN
jgi:hypothetical protein